MAYTYRYPSTGPTKINNRTSWGPMSTPAHMDVPVKGFDRPLSGNFDRIINAFEKTNTFEYVRSNFDPSEMVKEKNMINLSEDVVDEGGKDSDRFMGQSDFVVNRREYRCSSSYERADGNLASRQTPCSDDDVADYYQERILCSQARQLFPLQEDLADWINKTIGITYLNGDNFLNVLDNGVELCQLAAVIRDKAKEAVQNGHYKGPVPTIRGRCWQRAARRSFFSRDNMENFITFCRELGVHENLLFESDDLVLHAQPRQVILCLLEVARLATRYDLEPPGLVQLEREIALEERDSGLDMASWQFRESTPILDESQQTVDPPPTPTDANDSAAVSGYEGEQDSAPSERTDDASSRASDEDADVPLKPLNELDKRVQIVTRLMQRNCNCSEGKCSKLLKVKKVGEGRYNIAGRNVFIRLLKGRHMMVRVGGGWDTLEHFLSRHDPCQVRVVSPQSATAPRITTVELLHEHLSRQLDESDRHTNQLDYSDTNSRGSNLSVHSDLSHNSHESSGKSSSGKTSPSGNKYHNGKTSPSGNKYHNGKTSPSGNQYPSGITSPANGKISPVNGKVSLTNGKAKISPASSKTSIASSKVSSTGRVSTGKTSPSENKSILESRKNSSTKVPSPNRRLSTSSGEKSDIPISNPATAVKLNSTANAKSRAALRQSFTLPLQTSTPAKPMERKLSSPVVTTRTRKSLSSLNAISSYSTPTTPNGGSPKTPANEHRKSFCGTPSLNAPAKKVRSMSLASPIGYRSPVSTIKSPLKSPISPSSIERSIKMSLPLSASSPNKPFLHIKAKYRSPPPREVPPR